MDSHNTEWNSKNNFNYKDLKNKKKTEKNATRDQ